MKIRSDEPHLDGRQRLFAVALLDADVHIILAGVVGLRSIREGVCEGAAIVSIMSGTPGWGLGREHAGGTCTQGGMRASIANPARREGAGSLRLIAYRPRRQRRMQEEATNDAPKPPAGAKVVGRVATSADITLRVLWSRSGGDEKPICCWKLKLLV